MIVINLKRNLLLFIICSIYQSIDAQNIEFKNTNFRSNKEGLKEAQRNIKIADEFRENVLFNVLSMQDASKEAENAYLHYQKANDFNPNNADLNYKIASVLLFTNSKEFAKKYLDKAISLSPEFPNEFDFFQGMVWQLESEYEKAIDSYRYFMDNSRKKVVEQYNVLVKKYMAECTSAADILAKENRIWVDNLDINSVYDDWSPCLSADGDLLIFTSNRKNEHMINEIGFYDQDIYYYNLSDRNFKNTSSLSELNTVTDDVSGGLSYDGQRLLIYQKEEGNTDIF